MTEAPSGGLDAETLRLLRDSDEVRIETRAADNAAVHRTIIWIVVDERDRVLVRTYLGPTSRWYREAREHPACRLHVGGRVLDVVAEVADDADRVAAYSAAVARKYARHAATPRMRSPQNEPTTLELHPAPSDAFDEDLRER